MARTGYGRIYFKALGDGRTRVHRVPRAGVAVEAIVRFEAPYCFEIASFDAGDIEHTCPALTHVGGGVECAIADAYEIVRQGGLLGSCIVRGGVAS
ncbi:MAG: hypothetical protein JRI80_00445 [Deltaproteobacteria bacterium]|nr:hypothetical protein [Deltaproteobacteria bacterium]